MIQYHIYPGGKKRIVTFSYDDGHPNDERLAKLFNEYSVKATFHLNGSKYIGIGEEEKERLRLIYNGHEISSHTLKHGWPNRMPPASLVKEVMGDRRILEQISLYPVIGMSYPNGAYNDTVVDVLKACGIVYSRTVKSTSAFLIPDNFLKWHPTCHHSKSLEMCEKFIADIDSSWTNILFYVWGHSYEFREEKDWNMMENVLKKISHNDKIWYATNIEIYRYLTSQKQLVISEDERMFYNPTATDLWVEKDKKDIIKIPAGKLIQI